MVKAMAKTAVSLPGERVPKGNKQSSGKTKYGRMFNKGQKDAGTTGLPKSRS